MKAKSVLLLAAGLIASAAAQAEVSLKFDKNVPSQQARLLKEDVKVLSKFSSYTDAEMSSVMGFAGPVTATQLEKWLSDRVLYVLDEKMDFEKQLVMIKSSHSYENPGVLPTIPTGGSKNPGSDTASPTGSQPERKVMTVMTNIGTALYLVGKQSNALLGLDIPGIGKVPVTSPRTGIIQVGEGLFAPRTEEQKKSPDNELGKVYSRLATMFHEARHSDGNGKTLGFMHDACGKGHAYEGYMACDRSLNGSYSIGAYVGRAFAENCKACTAAQKEVLRLEYLDSFSRVVREWKQDKPGDDVLREVCAKLADVGVDMPTCKNLPAEIPVFKAGLRDARPEGKR